MNENTTTIIHCQADFETIDPKALPGRRILLDSVTFDETCALSIYCGDLAESLVWQIEEAREDGRLAKGDHYPSLLLKTLGNIYRKAHPAPGEIIIVRNPVDEQGRDISELVAAALAYFERQIVVIMHHVSNGDRLVFNTTACFEPYLP